MYVLDFAMKMERIGKTYYEKLASETSVAGIRNIFRMLADEQQELHDTFTAMASKGSGWSVVNSEELDGARQIFSKIFTGDGATAKVLKSDLDAYRYALEIQARIVAFFRQVASNEQDGEAKALLLNVVAEEERLYDEVRDIYEFVAAPTRHPAAIECSIALDMKLDPSRI